MAIICLSSVSTDAFQWQCQRPTIPTTNVRLNAEKYDNDRRTLLSRGGGAMALALLGAGTTIIQPAEASYTAYTRREDDWKQRVDKGGEILFDLACEDRNLVHC